MEVILSQDVDKIGKTGQVVKVKDGFARNFLFPQKMAFAATASNLKRIEQLEKVRKIQLEKSKLEAEKTAEKLSKVSCTITVEVNDLEKLYGAVTESDIEKALESEGYVYDKKDILIEKPVEELGIFEFGVKLHPQVVAKVRLWVTKK